MQGVVNYFAGNVRVEATCRYPERFMNICAANGVEFRELEYPGECTVRATMSLRDCERLKRRCAGQMDIHIIRKWGAPVQMYGLRKRYVLFIGMTLCFFAVWISSMFIMELEVSGNKTVPASRILAELDELGVGVGTCGFTISQGYISNEMLQRIPELCWIAVNVNGSRAQVLVREGIQPPELVDIHTPTVVYAAKAGIITDITAYDGKTVCEKGQTVVKGDILVTGEMDSPTAPTRLVHAMARVNARTWYELSAQMPLEYSHKAYTGETKTRTALVVMGNRINLYINSGISCTGYDKITEEKSVSLFGGAVLPIKVIKDTYAGYEMAAAELDADRAETLLRERLTERLQAEIAGGEIVKSEFSAETRDGVLHVTLKAECVEQIDAMRDLEANDISPAEPGEN